MRRAYAIADRLVSLPKGWAILGLALAAWGVLALAIQIASRLFHFVMAAI